MFPFPRGPHELPRRNPPCLLHPSRQDSQAPHCVHRPSGHRPAENPLRKTSANILENKKPCKKKLTTSNLMQSILISSSYYIIWFTSSFLLSKPTHPPQTSPGLTPKECHVPRLVGRDCEHLGFCLGLLLHLVLLLSQWRFFFFCFGFFAPPTRVCYFSPKRVVFVVGVQFLFTSRVFLLPLGGRRCSI